MDQPIIRISGLHKRFGDNHVLRGIDFDVQAGDRVAILGSSGSGKSTLLRCLNFMETPSEGQIALKGKTIGRLTDRGMRCLLYTSPSPRDRQKSRMPSSA